ncbi:hypothetical protein [uncultured Abyssibacter sp.]|uniref:hypothetical protein n=1 Tax=uncultured Abyssibacter sp. TaxID=2320202 RepID=UPI0032B1E607
MHARPRPSNWFIALLLLVAWTRVMAGVPEAVTHDAADAMTHEEVRDHVMTMQGHVGDESGQSDDHQHHLHLCCGGVAIPSEAMLTLANEPHAPATEPDTDSPIRRSRTLLRPPIA